jgi:superfamily II DNA or RNA helicase
MQRVRLRPWQLRALDRFGADARDFLAVATPGAGKTRFALAAALSDLAAHPHRRVVVVAPTQHLKVQWSRAAAGLALHLDPAWSARDGRLPADMHGVVVTYQQVAANPRALRGLARDAFVVFDEIHHAGDERAWGDGVREAFELSGRRLALSGTPFRSDTQAIPFVRYDDGEARADYEYGYGDALEEGGVVRPVFFPRIDGEMEWTAPDGSHRAHTFADRLDAVASGQRLRTALSLEGEWLPAVLDQAQLQLRTIRRAQPDAGGLVIAMDQEHARGIAALLGDRCGAAATVATSDDPAASARISRFAAGSEPWIVAVRMVSEGVDIPRLRVGVYATNTTTELFFRQAVGRLVRWTRGVRRQKAFLFLPDDPRLRAWAAGIAEQRRHRLRRRDDEDAAVLDGPPRVAERADEQLSLFAAISATAIGAPHQAEWADDAGEPGDEPPDDEGTVLTLAPPPLRAGGSAGAEPATTTRQEHKRSLRTGNADRARTIARLTGMTHAQVNRELNRLAGVRTISEATVAQLEARLRQADAWLRRL